jgi:hypothetical protein
MLQTAQSRISIDKIFTMLWCIWKARNDYLFNRKIWSVLQVHHAVAALLSYGIEDQHMQQEAPHLAANTTAHASITAPPVALLPAGPKASLHVQPIPRQQMASTPGTTVKDTSIIPRPIVFTDAAWLQGCDGQPVSAGLGLFIQFGDERVCSKVYISAVSPPVSSAIQAEAFGLLLATKAAEVLQLQGATFLTDNAVLAMAAASQDLLKAPGHWMIRPQLAEIALSSSFNATRIFHISRSLNFKAHYQAKLALKLQGRSSYFRCLNSPTGACLNSDITSLFSMPECMLLYVKCC